MIWVARVEATKGSSHGALVRSPSAPTLLRLRSTP
eukprot:CAMPEP_0179313414 /NCGR_PEP_ID=MMETSP0797-20121207/53814_1 /TAXON_ID=47934 /ORGANISM="Dinophysis acuminata, Strain DAEP01" /LENGTH=34 /DNA_ID= /DNA_START= /DNA_END= /DNA_ORIENTATION=